MSKLRVLVVDDSLTVRKRLSEVLGADPGIEVVGEAGDGRTAIELCRDLRPDVITLDMILPVLTGLDATEHIMAYFPTPILIVSASTNRGELVSTYEALAAGAVDVLDKSDDGADEGEWEASLLRAVKMVARIRVITHPRARLAQQRSSAPRSMRSVEKVPGVVSLAPRSQGAYAAPRAILIGASTGGPAAIIDVLRAIPAPCALPIVFVLHIGAPFGRAFAEWLDEQTPHRVAFAKNGESLAGLSGLVRMAVPDRHLMLRGGCLRLTDGAEVHSCRPSVDVLFESASTELGAAAIACLLTGMGRDGAAGMLAIRKAGGTTIAQDERSSVVFGMPREAILLGAAQRVLPLSEIGGAIAALSLP